MDVRYEIRVPRWPALAAPADPRAIPNRRNGRPEGPRIHP